MTAKFFVRNGFEREASDILQVRCEVKPFSGLCVASLAGHEDFQDPGFDGTLVYQDVLILVQPVAA